MDAKKAKDVTWSTVRYMISEIQYGGRITDDWDRRQMNTFAEKFFCQVQTMCISGKLLPLLCFSRFYTLNPEP